MPSAPRSPRSPSSPPSSSPTTRFAPSPSPILPPPWSCSACRVKQLDAMLAALDPTDRAPDAAVTVREGRYVIPVRSTARARIGGIVHDESATRATVFIEPPEVIELGNALRAAELDEQREVLQVLR